MADVTSLDLIHSALDVNEANLALGNETFAAAGATFVRNRSAPDIYDANHVSAIRIESAAEADALFARAEEEFAGNNRHRPPNSSGAHSPPATGRLRTG
jgi:hypothetical protein